MREGESDVKRRAGEVGRKGRRDRDNGGREARNIRVKGGKGRGREEARGGGLKGGTKKEREKKKGWMDGRMKVGRKGSRDEGVWKMSDCVGERVRE